MTKSLKKILLNKTQSEYFPEKLNKICNYWALVLQLKILRNEQCLYWFETALPRPLLLQTMAERVSEITVLLAAASNPQRQQNLHLEGLPANSTETEPASLINSLLHLPEGQCSHRLCWRALSISLYYWGFQ